MKLEAAHRRLKEVATELARRGVKITAFGMVPDGTHIEIEIDGETVYSGIQFDIEAGIDTTATEDRASATEISVDVSEVANEWQWRNPSVARNPALFMRHATIDDVETLETEKRR